MKLWILLFVLISHSLCAGLVFTKAPPHFSPKREKVLVYCHVGSEVLFLFGALGQEHGNAWAPVFGFTEKGESARVAAARLLKEDVRVELLPIYLYLSKTLYIRLPKEDQLCHVFFVSFPQRPLLRPSFAKHLQYRWSSLEEALQLPMTPLERECVILSSSA